MEIFNMRLFPSARGLRQRACQTLGALHSRIYNVRFQTVVSRVKIVQLI
jgi:hypothetical protein